MRAIITNAGYAALVNAQHNGTLPVTVAKVALGSGTTAADKTDTALANEIKRIDTIAGEAVDDNVISVTIRDEGQSIYSVHEFGLILADGTLFARYAQNDVIIEKSADSTLLLTTDCKFTDVDAHNITFGDTSFSNPPWGEDTKGILKKASEAEAEAGTDNSKGMTPKRTTQLLRADHAQATENKRGTAKLASEAQARALNDGETLITPDTLKAVLKDLLIEQSRTYTVGTGGDYATINAALEDLSKLSPVFKPAGIQVEVKLLAGFVMEEQVIVRDGLNLGWITITGEDAETTIAREQLTTTAFEGSFYPAFSAIKNASLPVIGTLFSMDGSGSAAGRHGIHVIQNSSAVVLSGCGIKNAGDKGIVVDWCSTVDANGCVFSGAGAGGASVSRCSSLSASDGSDFSNSDGDAVNVTTSSLCNVQDADCSNAAGYGIYASSVSTIIASSVDASYAGINAIYATHSSTVSAQNALCTHAGEEGIYAHHGATIDALWSDASNATKACIYGRHACIIEADAATLNNAGDNAVMALYGAYIDIDGASCKNANSDTVVAASGGRVICPNADCSGSGNNALRAYQGSSISGTNVDCTGAANYAVNPTSSSEIRCFNIKYSDGHGLRLSENTHDGSGNVIWSDGGQKA